MSTPWEVVAKDAKYQDDPPPQIQREIDYVTFFLNNCNENKESIETLVSMAVQDLLELDAGCFVKGFSGNSYAQTPAGGLKLQPMGNRDLVELWARDGGSMLYETDVNGVKYRVWQYSYLHPAVAPLEFDVNEIAYFMQYPRAYSVYGWSPLQSMDNILSSLINSAAWNSTFFAEATLPSGMIGVQNMNPEELERFRQYFRTEIKGRWHRIAVVNSDVKYVPFALTNRDMQWLDGQQWYAKIVMALFNVTPTELGFTDDIRATGKAMGAQDEVGKRKSTLPILRLIEQVVNNQIVSELSQVCIFRYKPVDRSEELMQIDVDNKDMQGGKRTINQIRAARGLGPPVWFGEEPMDIIKARIMRGEPIPPLALPKVTSQQGSGSSQPPAIQRSFIIRKSFDQRIEFDDAAFLSAFKQTALGKAWPPVMNPLTGQPHTQDDTIPKEQYDAADENANFQKGLALEDKEISGNRIGWGKEQREDYLGQQAETIPGANQRGQLPTAIGRKPAESDARDGMMNPTDIGGEVGGNPVKPIKPGQTKPVPSAIGTRGISAPNYTPSVQAQTDRDSRFYPGPANNATRPGPGDAEKPYDDTIDIRNERNRPKDQKDSTENRIISGDPLDHFGAHPWGETGTFDDSLLYGHRRGMDQEHNPAYQKGFVTIGGHPVYIDDSKAPKEGTKERAQWHQDQRDKSGKAADRAFQKGDSEEGAKQTQLSKAHDYEMTRHLIKATRPPELYNQIYGQKQVQPPDSDETGVTQFPTGRIQEEKKKRKKDMRYDSNEGLPTQPVFQDSREHDDWDHSRLKEEPKLNPNNSSEHAGDKGGLDEYQLDRLRQSPAGPAATLPSGKKSEDIGTKSNPLTYEPDSGGAWRMSESGERTRIDGDATDDISGTRKAKTPAATGFLRDPTSEPELDEHLPPQYADEQARNQFLNDEQDLIPHPETPKPNSQKDLDLSGTLQDQIQRFGEMSDKTDKEFGALLIRRDGQLVLDQVQIGEDHAVEIEPTRPLAPNEEILGSFHIHPKTAEFSTWDILSFLHSDWEKAMLLRAADGNVVVALKTPETQVLQEDPEKVRDSFGDPSNAELAQRFKFTLFKGPVDNLEQI